MTDKQIIIDGCEFQSDCIEYKDISYLKIMPICAIHELSIACHDKVNKCKYYKLYKQLKAKEQECEELKKDKFALELRLDELTSPVNVEDCEHSVFNGEYIACRYYEGQRCDDADFANCMYRENIRLKQQLDKLKQTNEELRKCHKNNSVLLDFEETNTTKLVNKVMKIEKTLTEIKEIAEKIDDSDGCAYGDYSCDNCSSLEQEIVCTYKVKKLILQKISEVQDV